MKNPKECFLIDDDIEDQEIFSIALEEIDKNISCVWAKNGIEGIEKLSNNKSFKPSYIFIDINMPKMNGIACVTEIKKFDHLMDTKIIMFSTSLDAKIMATCKELGVNDFLVKPASFTLLVESLRKILD